jgi:hypothetical protein
MGIEKRAGCEYAEGAIKEHRLTGQFVVHLDDGRTVTAIIPRSKLRKLGCLLGSLEGWRVTVVFRAAPKPPAIIDLSAASGSEN